MTMLSSRGVWGILVLAALHHNDQTRTMMVNAIDSHERGDEVPSGFVCQRDDDCLHGGSCLMVSVPPPGPSGIQIQAPPQNECMCQTNYSGRRCERFDCVKKCLNGGYCIAGDHRSGSEMQCSCPAGFKGDECEEIETDVEDDATSTPTCNKKCLNGGECHMPDVSNPNNMACSCPPGYKGERCEIIFEICLDLSECFNGGSCVAPIPGSGSEAFSCNCPNDTSGPNCGTLVADPVVPPQHTLPPGVDILEDIEMETGLTAAGIFAIVVSCIFFVISVILLLDSWRQRRGYQLQRAAAKVNTAGVFDPVDLCNEVEKGII